MRWRTPAACTLRHRTCERGEPQLMYQQSTAVSCAPRTKSSGRIARREEMLRSISLHVSASQPWPAVMTLKPPASSRTEAREQQGGGGPVPVLAPRELGVQGAVHHDLTRDGRRVLGASIAQVTKACCLVVGLVEEIEDQKRLRKHPGRSWAA